MTNKTGLDVEQVRAMGRKMQAQADHISTTMVPTIDRLVRSATVGWDTPNGRRFVEWWRQHRARLLKAATDLRGLGQSALNNADEQERVSAGAGGVGSPRPGGGSLPGSVLLAGGAGLAGVLGRIDGSAFLESVKGQAEGMLAVMDTADRLRLLGRLDALQAAGKLDVGFIAKHYGAAFDLGKNVDMGVLDGLSLTLSTLKMFEAASNGDVDGTIRNGIDVAWTGAGLVYPPVGWAKTAWDGGYFVGSTLSKGLDSVFHVQDNIVATGVAHTYRGDLTDVQNADNLSKRYDGVSGFGNFLYDSVRFW